MQHMQKRAVERWKKDLQQRLSAQTVGEKKWWTCIKLQQCLCKDDIIPPLMKFDGTVATISWDEAQVLANVL